MMVDMYGMLKELNFMDFADATIIEKVNISKRF
jgi:hypothetical protein